MKRRYEVKNNWFPTLNDALESEGLVEVWPLGLNIDRDQTESFITEDFRHVSVYRSSTGSYERPVHYSTK